MEMPVMPGLVETWVARDRGGTAASSARGLAQQHIRRIQRDRLTKPATRPATLHAYRSKRYASQPRPVALFLLLAVLASAMTMAIMIAVPWHVEMSAASHGSLQRSRIAELALLQRDALLAGACWPHECALSPRR